MAIRIFFMTSPNTVIRLFAPDSTTVYGPYHSTWVATRAFFHSLRITSFSTRVVKQIATVKSLVVYWGEIERFLLNTSIFACFVIKCGDDHLVTYGQSSDINDEQLREHCQSYLLQHLRLRNSQILIIRIYYH
jgi:hypothetical protein